MTNNYRLLSFIEEALVQHGGDLGGWTQLDDESLKVFDGRVTLRAQADGSPRDSPPAVAHCHVFATLHEQDDEELDACLMGIGDSLEDALREAAMLWITGVAGPIRSFLENKPVCMTCQAGVANGDVSRGYAQGDYGLPNLRAYVGPSFARGFGDDLLSGIDDSRQWFQYSAQAAAPKNVHLVKATIQARGTEGWVREMEIDGHEVAFREADWNAGIPAPSAGYITRYAVFEFPRNSKVISNRLALEKTITRFAMQFSKFETVEELEADMAGKGFHPQLIHAVKSISTIAFSRFFFEPYGINFSPHIIRARKDGRVQSGIPLISIPAFTRARAIAGRLSETMPEEEFRRLCFYNAEAQAILGILEQHGRQEIDWSGVSLYPCVVPDLGVSDETMDKALDALDQMIGRDDGKPEKPWWKFW